MTLRLKNSSANIPALHARAGNESREHFFGAGNEINANDNAELMRKIGELMTLAATGKVNFTGASDDSSQEIPLAKRKEMLTAAVKDYSANSKFNEIGAGMAGKLSEVLDRTGFMRQILTRQEVSEGSIPQHKVQSKSVSAVVAGSPTHVHPLMVRDRKIFPNEFPIVANILVSDIDLVQTPGDLLEDKYDEGLEAMQLQEDRMVLGLLDATVGQVHKLQYFSGGLAPSSIGSMSADMYSQGVQNQSILMAADFWADIASGTAFSAYLEPVSKYELMQTGRIGRILGNEIITDGFRHEKLRAVAPGTLYILGQPQYLGAFTDRGPVEATETNGAVHGIPARGWFFKEILSAAIHNSRAVVKGVRA